MSVILITPEKQAEITAAIERARQKVIPWDQLRGSVVDTPTDTLTLEERRTNPYANPRPMSEHILFEGGVHAAISFEEQPAGIMRHFSVSTRDGRKVLPLPLLMAVAHAFGIDLPLTKLGRAWVEEYAPGKYAVNIVVLEVEREAGHA